MTLVTPDIQNKIRIEIHNQYKIGRRITMTSLWNTLKANLGEEFKWSRASLHRLLNPLGFAYKRVTDRCFLFENQQLIRLRHTFLKVIFALRKEDAFLCYCDETWLFEGMRSSHDFVDLFAQGNL